MARQASTLGEGDVQVLEDAAQLQLAAGGTRDALETYEKIARLKPASAEAQFRLASVQYLTDNGAIAKQTLQKALELKPDLQEALILLAKLEASGGNRDPALKLAEKVKKLPPTRHPVFVLEGDVEMLSKKYASAAKAYERAYAIRKSGDLAAQIHQAYLRAGKPEQGEAVVLNWLQEKPTDARTRQYLADSSMQSSRLAVAVPQYEWLAQNQPGNQQVLNNLAWAYSEIGRCARRRDRRKGVQAQRDQSGRRRHLRLDPVTATHKFPEAVDMLRRAVELAPNSRDIRYHYAQALAKAGDRKNARLELERVLAGSTPFASQAEAKALLDQLKS